MLAFNFCHVSDVNIVIMVLVSAAVKGEWEGMVMVKPGNELRICMLLDQKLQAVPHVLKKTGSWLH